MSGFIETLKTQRWDDHRYYHHSLINQSLHFLSASCFMLAYVVMFWDPWLAAVIGWMISMTSRQCGHFFFEPKGYDEVNHASHEYKEEIKVGYNLRRKVVLMTIWALSPVVIYFEPSLFNMVRPWISYGDFLRRVGQVWLLLGIGGLAFRTVQLFFIRDVMTGLCWATKILTDPINDFKLYHKAPLQLLRGDRFDWELDADMAEQA